MKESVLRIDCEGERLVGILAEPDGGPVSDIGVLIIVGGPQYRAGSHRQFTLLARHLAQHGHAALRFDYRGMGDSAGETRDFEAVGADLGAAIETLLRSRPALRRVALFGLCDGASAALLYLHDRPDPRVCGLVLLNPWIRSAAGLARVHVKHYYLQRLGQPEFWRKLLRGGVGRQALAALAANVRLLWQPASATAGRPGFQARMASAAAAFGRPMLLLLSENDFTAKEFADHAAQSAAWQGRVAQADCRRHQLAGADHTLSERDHLEAAHSLIVQWMTQLASRP